MFSTPTTNATNIIRVNFAVLYLLRHSRHAINTPIANQSCPKFKKRFVLWKFSETMTNKMIRVETILSHFPDNFCSWRVSALASLWILLDLLIIKDKTVWIFAFASCLMKTRSHGDGVVTLAEEGTILFFYTKFHSSHST